MSTTPRRVFLLSPASCRGKRAAMLLGGRGRFPLAEAVRTPAGAPLGDVFAFLSGLYFRGKLAYARRFAGPGSPGVFVITPSRGLIAPETPARTAILSEFASTDITLENPAYLEPLRATAWVLRESLGARDEVILLGSIATPKYVDPLLEIYGDRLRFPADFVGRGDMSRGGLMLRAVEQERELAYLPVAGAVRRGPRPPRLPRNR